MYSITLISHLETYHGPFHGSLVFTTINLVSLYNLIILCVVVNVVLTCVTVT